MVTCHKFYIIFLCYKIIHIALIRIFSKLLPEAPNSSTSTGGHHICTTFMLTVCLLGHIFFDQRIYVPMIYKHHNNYPKTMPKILISSLRWPAFIFGTNVKGIKWCHTSNGSLFMFVSLSIVKRSNPTRSRSGCNDS
mgnify:CR=1 FL=1